MKRFIAAILCAGLIAVATTGCGYTDALAQNSSSQTQETSQADDNQSATADEVSEDNFDDNLDGLCNYFAKMDYIATKKDAIDESALTKMDASLIGAKSGNKFTTKYNGKAVTIELYEYDTKNLNDTAKDVIASVEKDGTFTILELPAVKAYLSDNGKYLMVYTDSSIDDEEPDTESDNYKHREEVIENFKSFHK